MALNYSTSVSPSAKQVAATILASQAVVTPHLGPQMWLVKVAVSKQ